MTIDKPTAYTKSGNYIFISYSNLDWEPVYKAITVLQKQGINVWYDEDLDAEKITGDNKRLDTWKDQVKDKIENDNCKAVIFFISENVLKYNKAIRYEMSVVNDCNKSYCAVSLIKEISGNQHIKKYIHKYFRKLEDALEDQNVDSNIYDENVDNLMDADFDFRKQFPEDKIEYHYSEQVETQFAKVIKQIREWGYQEDEDTFPNGNVIHNGHIEYFPAVLEATPFNFTYFLIARGPGRTRIGESLKGILQLYTDRVHEWREYSLSSFLKEDFEALEKATDDRLMVYMKEKDISSVELLLKRRREYVNNLPMVVCISVEENKFEEIKKRLRKALAQMDWEDEVKIEQSEIDPLILVQTDLYCMRQKLDSASDVSDIRDVFERWRVLLSDKYYFKEVLELCGDVGVQRLLHQRTPYSAKREYMDADRRLAERWDRDRFIKQKFNWEDEKNV